MEELGTWTRRLEIGRSGAKLRDAAAQLGDQEPPELWWIT